MLFILYPFEPHRLEVQSSLLICWVRPEDGFKSDSSDHAPHLYESFTSNVALVAVMTSHVVRACRFLGGFTSTLNDHLLKPACECFDKALDAKAAQEYLSGDLADVL